MTNETKSSCILLTCIAVLLSLFVWGVIKVDENNQRAFKEKRESGHYLPAGATDIIDVGDYWQEFTYKNQRFLFCRDGAVVKIDIPKVENN